MNREKWKELSDEDKQIKIAELCGWTRLYMGDYDPDGHCFTYIKVLLGLPPEVKETVEKSEKEG